MQKPSNTKGRDPSDFFILGAKISVFAVIVFMGADLFRRLAG